VALFCVRVWPPTGAILRARFQIIDLEPEYIGLGYHSRPKPVPLIEPSPEKLREFMKKLSEEGVQIREKEMRGMR